MKAERVEKYWRGASFWRPAVPEPVAFSGRTSSIADSLPDLAAHTNDDIDFDALRGKSIAILGGGASAWDNAATALERGAARVDMYVRRPYLPQVNKGRGSAFPGFLHGWSSLPDAERWATMVYLNDIQSPVPHETVNRTIAAQPASISIFARRSKRPRARMGKLR